jgi:flap endonuclease-1
LGCDYCDSIKGIGPKRAVDLVKEHGSIEEILKNIDATKYSVPEDWDYQGARKLFVLPDVHDTKDIEVLYKLLITAYIYDSVVIV